MKKLMSLCLVACLILSLCQLALADVNDLSKAEFTSYTESLLKDALTVNRYQAEQTDGGYLLHFDRYTLKTDSDRLSANTKINGVIFDDLSDADDGMGDIRSVKLNDSMAVLLAAYPLENTALAGTREDAVLYIAGELPGQATVGYMKRDGQRALEITYSLYYMADGGVGVNTIQYTLKDGAVDQSNYHDYEVLRMSQMPKIETYIVPSAEAPTGVGEPGTPVVLPAVANALLAVTGVRTLALPMTRQSYKQQS